MSLSIETLQQQAKELQKQLEATNQMMNQTAGALNMVNHFIQALMKEESTSKDSENVSIEHQEA